MKKRNTVGLDMGDKSHTICVLDWQGQVVERAVADPVLARQGRKMLALRVERFVALSSQAACRNAKANW